MFPCSHVALPSAHHVLTESGLHSSVALPGAGPRDAPRRGRARAAGVDRAGVLREGQPAGGCGQRPAAPRRAQPARHPGMCTGDCRYGNNAVVCSVCLVHATMLAVCEAARNPFSVPACPPQFPALPPPCSFPCLLALTPPISLSLCLLPCLGCCRRAVVPALPRRHPRRPQALQHPHGLSLKGCASLGLQGKPGSRGRCIVLQLMGCWAGGRTQSADAAAAARLQLS